MKDFRLDQEARGAVQIIRLAGSLDMYSLPRLESHFDALFQQSRYFLVVDCHSLDYVGSSGLGALIGFAKQAREHNGDLCLLNVPERIYKSIELLGFRKALGIHKTEEEAVGSF